MRIEVTEKEAEGVAVARFNSKYSRTFYTVMIISFAVMLIFLGLSNLYSPVAYASILPAAVMGIGCWKFVTKQSQFAKDFIKEQKAKQ